MQIGGIRLDTIARAIRSEAKVDKIEAAGRPANGATTPARPSPPPLPGAPAPDLLQPRPTVIAFPLRAAPEETAPRAPGAQVARAYEASREGRVAQEHRASAAAADPAEAAETVLARAAPRAARRIADNDTPAQATLPRAAGPAPAPWFALLPEPLRRLIDPNGAGPAAAGRRQAARAAGAGAALEQTVEGGWKEAKTLAAIVAMSVLGLWLLLG